MSRYMDTMFNKKRRTEAKECGEDKIFKRLE